MSLSEKLRNEAREQSQLFVARSTSGLPNHICATDLLTGKRVWSGHRDLAPPNVRFARDPMNLLSRPASD